MTDNLQSKFADLETILVGQHNDLVEQLTATNTKLDALATALAPLATIATTLGDVHLDTQSMDLKLLRLQNGLTADPALNYTNAQQLLATYTARFDQTMGLLGPNGDRPIMGLLTQLVNNLGLPTGDATTTALGLLAALVHCCGLSAPPSVPVSGDPDGCADQFASDTLVATSASYPGRSFVTWVGPLPNGAVFTTDLNLGINHAEITPEATWEGWKIFVYSLKASYYSEDPTRSGQWPTNVWRDLTEAQGYPIAISVPSGDDVQAFLCPPIVVGCPSYTSESVNWTDPAAGSGTRQMVEITAISNRDGYYAATTHNAPVSHHIDPYQMQLTVTSGSGVTFADRITGSSTIHNLQTGVQFTVPEHANEFIIFSDSAFTIEVCLPPS